MAVTEPLVWLIINDEIAPTPRCPNGYTPVYSDFDTPNSKRNEVAFLKRECIRRNVVSPKFAWRIKTPELSKLLNMIDHDSLNVKIYDLMTMAMREFTGYAQATRQPSLVLQGKTYKDCWWDFECSFIEY